MAISKEKRSVTGLFKQALKFIFLHDLQTHRKGKHCEKRDKDWICDEGRLIPRPVQQRLKQLLGNESKKAKKKGVKFPVKDYLLIDLGLQSGLRVEEMCNLEIRDLYLDDVVIPFVHVRHGKGDEERRVQIPTELVRHLKKYMSWKKKFGEPTNETAPLFYSVRRGKFTKMALQKSFGRWIKKVTKMHHSIHDLRHTYASELLLASGGDFTLVSRQLGHRNINTTMKYYAHVVSENTVNSLKKLYK